MYVDTNQTVRATTIRYEISDDLLTTSYGFHSWVSFYDTPNPKTPTFSICGGLFNPIPYDPPYWWNHVVCKSSEIFLTTQYVQQETMRNPTIGNADKTPK